MEPSFPVRRPKLELLVAGAFLLVFLSVFRIGLALFELLVMRYRLKTSASAFADWLPSRW